ncbi:SecD/SecF fusion protein [Verrucomicrobium sp. GAS474]|uniref:protein translocase subunit SecD n=1 Tax=Verrucomicrobium sp. GAS474 TaxID=1882831 RepID=UPI000879C995|nr:protein translocase subunit SecD [Verrucomicrobium sp. GAS474]SDT86620.1 SecD/SecF fusion protein [Verrucomicrobium sp. GAS474]
MIYTIFATSLAFFVFLIWYIMTDDAAVRRRVGLASILAVVASSLFSLYPIQETVKLGLDLKGGTAFLIQLDGTPSAGARDKAIEVIRKRVDKYGMAEPLIQPVGENRISVQIPGLTDEHKGEARAQLSKVAKLEFRLVHPDNEALLAARRAGTGTIPLEYEVLPSVSYDIKGEKVHTEIVVKRRAEMSGKYVARAFASIDEVGRPTVIIHFTDPGKEIFGPLTEANIGKRLAIVLDNEVQTAPNINSAIYDTCVISNDGGGMKKQEAEELASVLENPLETPVKLLEERGVDASLGRDSIVSGQKAVEVAIAAVALFMIAYYHFAGVIATVGLVLNLLMLFGMLAQFHFTLTLPGIAGIVLTIGMAVDANVLIYERIRDEQNLGKPLRVAAEAGFARAFSAIFDAHVTNLVPAVILVVLGSGPLQGFAITLILGIVANLFAALVVTKNSFEWLTAFDKFDRLSMFHFLKNPKIDFIKAARTLSWVTVIVLVVGLLHFATHRENLLGVDFAGGDLATITYKQKVSVEEVRGVVEKAGVHVGSIQTTSEGKLLLQTRFGEGEKAVASLVQAFPDAGFAASGLDSVGPVVGGELATRALWTLAAGLLGIMLYVAFRYEWSFSLAATIGQIHDVLVAVAVMALLGREFNMTLIGAFLTILGYSINDKIVISDRIREGWRGGEAKSFYDVVNRGLNLTLARTLMTGGTVILAVLALLVFGGRVIGDFALAMLAGILAGVFSSHFLTPWLLVRFQGVAEKQRRAEAAKLAAAAAAIQIRN